jgi:hypothetical protein
MSSWDRALIRMNKTLTKTYPSEGIFTPVGGTRELHVCIHDQGYMELLNGQGEVAQSGIFHKAFIVISDLTRTPKTTDGYAIGDVEYEIVDVQPDGSGGVNLMLLVKA